MTGESKRTCDHVLNDRGSGTSDYHRMWPHVRSRNSSTSLREILVFYTCVLWSRSTQSREVGAIPFPPHVFVCDNSSDDESSLTPLSAWPWIRLRDVDDNIAMSAVGRVAVLSSMNESSVHVISRFCRMRVALLSLCVYTGLAIAPTSRFTNSHPIACSVDIRPPFSRHITPYNPYASGTLSWSFNVLHDNVDYMTSQDVSFDNLDWLSVEDVRSILLPRTFGCHGLEQGASGLSARIHNVAWHRLIAGRTLESSSELHKAGSRLRQLSHFHSNMEVHSYQYICYAQLGTLLS